ncbi:TLC domain-containing protein 4-B [Octopus bimaculoides]|uniref:TLC domain-containing protein n=2 Tax=Octopus TaxID=6643 RepID=A0A0L8I9S3_OCTBM|nr:TLC domain-containing protein 4-B-like [Octopus sinensis]XP_052826207.1 TLC domain-containing protein 4-B [Octopus bimaculoides]XP_052826208.1 TLC domain-containing protein 4-B [Octopus bimaculoides]XP_052826209.1 TLC domain-containing protein 4-B [Octopus bimaculoides]XP_052826210.1 TLC domain-containing protein 4-B [Octopus bimaculoides]XP_052826211.1 TLC domain-containing protein 4-B [Octopus bimaculoides]|eukprot:XP_014783289.1 PREDICTED: transmembrane protein 56-B-like [Octopus bimaculoides]
MSSSGDIIWDTSYFRAACLSCVAFLIIYKYVSPILSAFVFPGYLHLHTEKKIDWNTRVISSIHAAVVSSMCAYTLLYDAGLSKDPIWWDAPVVRTSCAIVVGYMVADLIIMTVHYKTIGEVFYFFHHGASIYAYVYVMTIGVLPYFANYRLIAEFSTPFVNQRWFLDVLGYEKKSSLFVVNGIVMTIVFFLVRVACMPLYWYKVYSVCGTHSFITLGHMRYVLVFTCVVLDSINLYWFYRMCAGVRKVLTSHDKNRNIKTQ